jgi:hypothetical protein
MAVKHKGKKFARHGKQQSRRTKNRKAQTREKLIIREQMAATALAVEAGVVPIIHAEGKSFFDVETFVSIGDEELPPILDPQKALNKT